MRISSSEREEILARWVKQPPASPAVQYLRDIEWHRALEFMGTKGSVLDVASEVNVTRRLRADQITRVDFSKQASDRARNELGGAVRDLAVIDAEDPRLPFATSAFDGVISIGPYDHLFLDVERLTREIHRVLAPGGRVVLSVPTPRSPYYMPSHPRHRFYEFADLESLVQRSGLKIEKLAYLYHPRALFLRPLNNRFIPRLVQQLFTWPCWWVSELITRLDWKHQASFVVVAALRCRSGGGEI